MATSSEVPGRFPVAIDGRAYVADLSQYRRQSLDLFRQQADGGREFDESSLNPEDLWRRSQIDWRYGAGAEYLDRGSVNDTDRRRFSTSTNIDPWVDGGKFRLQKTTTQVLAQTAGSTARTTLTTAGGRLVYVVSATTAKYSDTAGTTWTAVPGLPLASTVNHAASDGQYVYFACTTNGVYRWNSATPTTAATRINTLNAEFVWWAHDRLICVQDGELYNITDLGSTTPPTSFGGVTSGLVYTMGATNGYIVFGAWQGSDSAGYGRSTLYRVTIREDGTALSAPVACAELPDGELIYAILGYVGVVLLGTSEGIRLAQMSGGELIYGPLIEVGEVTGFEPQGNYVWYKLRAGGVGRMDLSRFADELQPAYASDLTGNGTSVWSEIVTFGGYRWFATSAGVYRESATVYASTGSITSPIITFGVVDRKVPVKLLVQFESLPAGSSVTGTVRDATTQATLMTGTTSTTGATELEVDLSAVPATLPDSVDVVITLTRSTATTSTPVVTRWTLFANPIPRRGERFIVPVILRSTVTDVNGQDYHLTNPYSEFLALKTVEQAGLPVDYQEFGQSYTAFIDGVQFGPELEYGPSGKPEGLCLVSLRVFS